MRTGLPAGMRDYSSPDFSTILCGGRQSRRGDRATGETLLSHGEVHLAYRAAEARVAELEARLSERG